MAEQPIRVHLTRDEITVAASALRGLYNRTVTIDRHDDPATTIIMLSLKLEEAIRHSDRAKAAIANQKSAA